MKTRLLWIAIAALGIATLYIKLFPPHVSTLSSELRNSIGEIKPPPLPPFEPPPLVIPTLPELAPPALPPPTSRITALSITPPEVPIQNDATIDFSTGSPHVKMYGKDKEDLDAAIREIADVAAKTGFEAKKEGGPNARP